MNKLILIILVLHVASCSLVTGINTSYEEYIKRVETAEREYSRRSTCKEHSQCVVVEDYCGCSAGGGRSAIHVNLADQREFRKLEFKEGVVCPTVWSTSWTCGDKVTARCVKEKCVLMSDEYK